MLSNNFYNNFLLYFSTSFLEQRENRSWSKGKPIGTPKLIKVVPHQINLLNLKMLLYLFC
jgi:hypothetical protein